MTDDDLRIDRIANQLVIEFRRASGSPPSYSGWTVLYDVKVDDITINAGAKPSTATLWFPSLRWDEEPPIQRGDMVLIRNDEPSLSMQSIIFSGIVTAEMPQFSGGDNRTSGFERNAVVCQDFRWLLSATCPIFGQMSRGPDDYEGYDIGDRIAKDDNFIFLTGRRAIFNENNRPNRDPLYLKLKGLSGDIVDVPIFCNSGEGEYWTARQMLIYCLSPLWNRIYNIFPLFDPSEIPGVDHADWDKVLGHIVIDGLNVIESVELICRHIGWSFRQINLNNYEEPAFFDFYRLASATGFVRTNSQPCIAHRLYSPAVGESVGVGVSKGKKLLWSMLFQRDITSIINRPVGLSAPQRFEFTAELVPAWQLDELIVYDDLYFTEKELQEMDDPNSEEYYKYYHVRGNLFKRNVGRKWSLNETGRYTGGNYDRGKPFDFSTVIPRDYIYGGQPAIFGKESNTKKRIYAPYNRQLLPCLTQDKENINSIGIIVEFSFDAGDSWQIIPCSIRSLPNEAGIYIEEENLAEMIDEKLRTIDAGPLATNELNYWTSLCDDVVNSRSFKDGEWNTRVRVTASMQMDQKLFNMRPRRPSSGSPFHHLSIYDFSQRYGFDKRTEQSQLNDSDLYAYEIDSTEIMENHLDAVRNANQDMSISGSFELERLWLGDGTGEPEFMVGDCIMSIDGRDYSLKANLAGDPIYPEIIQIIYKPDTQHIKLITRDLRFAEVPI
jgi:hypothetical protein